MSKIEEHNLGDEHTKLIFPCDCHDDHYVHISWDEDDEDWRYLFLSNQWRPMGLRDKIRDCIKILRNREYLVDTVILNEKSIQAIRTFLEDKYKVNDEDGKFPIQ